GTPRLPFLSGLAACPVTGTSWTGGVNWLLVPNLWDPFRDSWDLKETNAGNTGNGPQLTPGYLRPPVRITVSGNVSIGTVLSSVSPNSGSIPTSSVTPSPAPPLLTISSQSMTLTTGGAS